MELNLNSSFSCERQRGSCDSFHDTFSSISAPPSQPPMLVQRGSDCSPSDHTRLLSSVLWPRDRAGDTVSHGIALFGISGARWVLPLPLKLQTPGTLLVQRCSSHKPCVLPLLFVAFCHSSKKHTFPTPINQKKILTTFTNKKIFFGTRWPLKCTVASPPGYPSRQETPRLHWLHHDCPCLSAMLTGVPFPFKPTETTYWDFAPG